MKKLVVKNSSIQGKGIFTTENIQKGERVAFVIGTKKVFKSKNAQDALNIPTWYGITKFTWIDPEKSIFRYFNHSCQPNTAIVGTKTVIARRDISANEEITFDYSFTDGDINWTLDKPCHCGSKNCRKSIKSIQTLPASIILEHYPLIPKYFLNMYRKAHPDVKI